MHVTFLAPFLWYQLLKLAVDRSSSPCLPNCILFFDNSEHPHQSLPPSQSHWLMALPAGQNRNEQEKACMSQENNRKNKIKSNGTTHNKTPPSYSQFSTNSKYKQMLSLPSSTGAVRFKYSTLFKWHSYNLLH